MRNRCRRITGHGYRWAAIGLVTMAATAMPAASSAADADAVRDWSEIAAFVIASPAPMAARAGAAGNIDLAYVHAAIYDAVNAIDRHHSVFAVEPVTPAAGGSAEAATAAAAYTVLIHFFTTPEQQAYINQRYAQYLLTIPDGPAKATGIAVGTEVATRFLDLRSGDGRNAPVQYQYAPPGPGVYQSTTPGNPTAPPATPWLALLKPFAMKDVSQFRADGPPNLTSAQWAEDYNEVKTWGAKTGSPRTQEQTDTGWFYTDNPVLYYNRNVRAIAATQGLTTVASARYFALTYITMADAGIACWDSKYFFKFWRPVTAIVNGAIDGNDATAPDPNWLPLAPTPTHPEYPSAHGCFTSAIAYSIERFFGTKKIATDFTACSVPGHPCPAGLTHSFETTQEILRDVIVGRIYGGMHYRTSVVHGIVIGNKVSHWVAKNYFLPVN